MYFGRELLTVFVIMLEVLILLLDIVANIKQSIFIKDTNPSFNKFIFYFYNNTLI